MEIIENGADHRPCLVSKGLIDDDEVAGGEVPGAASAAIDAEAGLARKVRGAE